MRNRIFLKGTAAFVAVIPVATLTLDLGIRRTWESSLWGNIERLLVHNAQGFALGSAYNRLGYFSSQRRCLFLRLPLVELQAISS